MRPVRLLGIESNRSKTLDEIKGLLDTIGFKPVEVTIEDFTAAQAGFSLAPVSTLSELFDVLPTEFILTERTQLQRVLMGAMNYNGAYVSVIRNTRSEFCGLVVTDLFWDQSLWCYATLYKNSQAGGEIRALLGPALEYWRKEFEGLRMLANL